MVDDSQAFRMAPSDWYVEAMWRFGAALLVGIAFGGLAYVVNRRWVTPLLPEWPLLGTRTALWHVKGRSRGVIRCPAPRAGSTSTYIRHSRGQLESDCESGDDDGRPPKHSPGAQARPVTHRVVISSLSLGGAP